MLALGPWCSARLTSGVVDFLRVLDLHQEFLASSCPRLTSRPGLSSCPLRCCHWRWGLGEVLKCSLFVGAILVFTTLLLLCWHWCLGGGPVIEILVFGSVRRFIVVDLIFSVGVHTLT